VEPNETSLSQNRVFVLNILSLISDKTIVFEYKEASYTDRYDPSTYSSISQNYRHINKRGTYRLVRLDLSDREFFVDLPCISPTETVGKFSFCCYLSELGKFL
jgi:hypothetical protein